MNPGPLEAQLAELRTELSDAPDPSLIFSAGQRIASLAETAPAACVQRIAVAGSLTSDFLARAIACAVVQEGVLPLLYQSPFGALRQDILDPASALHRFRPDLVVIAPDWRDEVEDLPLDTTAETVAALTRDKVRGFEQLWATLPARIVQHTLTPPAWGLCGPAERLFAGSFENQVLALNRGLLQAGGAHWVELDRLAASVGLRAWSDEGGYHAARLPFSLKYLGDYMAWFRPAWRAANARTRKVLVLDLDNTLWGGVIGDDGVDGIALGPGSAAGEAFQAWGRHVKRLRDRGVVLAVCSRNDPALAAAAFDHPGCVLRRADFAAFECSWDDKATGLRRIARDIGVGLDSLVFADDNPAECEQVRHALPEVAVVHLGAEPTRFVALLERGHWFDAPRYTAEDMGRGPAYAARAQARAEQVGTSDVGHYLAGLRMVATLAEAQPCDIARLAQMEQRTNQFNLTTRRHDEAGLAGFIGRSDAVVLVFRLADKFGDHGLVSSLIAVAEGDALRIDSWLMSCRVFSRTAEQYILRRLVRLARTRGCTRIIGEYRPTARNGVVAELYAHLGFAPAGEGLWRLDLANVPELETFIAESAGLATA